MKRFVEGEDRNQVTLLPECLDDFVVEDNPVRVIDVFIDELDLTGLGFEGVAPADTGRPAYHPAVLLKLYVYRYLNRPQSRRHLAELDRARREPTLVTEGRGSRLKEKVATVKAHMEQLKQIGQQLREAPDGQVSLTDPDARSMATSGRGTGIVGYNVQTAV